MWLVLIGCFYFYAVINLVFNNHMANGHCVGQCPKATHNLSLVFGTMAPEGVMIILHICVYDFSKKDRG